METPRITFYGSPALCIPYLESLEAVGLCPSRIVTAPPRPFGRKQVMTKTPVHLWAEEKNIPVFTPTSIDTSFISDEQASKPDIAIVVAFGLIFPKELIDTPVHGTINVHYSILPRWRGASPVEATILAGDTVAGVSIQKMLPKLDSGPVIADASIELYGDETSDDLKDVLTDIGSDLLIETLPVWLNDALDAREQDETHVTLCRKIKRDDGKVSLDMKGEELWRRFRAYSTWPGIFFFSPDGTRTKILEATYEDGTFTPVVILPEGKKALPYTPTQKIQ